MNEILDDITQNLNFYNPYFKQFKIHLQGKSIAIMESHPSKAYEYFANEDYEVICVDSYENLEHHPDLDGIIINNFKYEDIGVLINKVCETLNDTGIMLLIFNNQIYDKETINFLTKEKFALTEELIGDDKWNFILYSKKTTK